MLPLLSCGVLWHHRGTAATNTKTEVPLAQQVRLAQCPALMTGLGRKKKKAMWYGVGGLRGLAFEKGAPNRGWVGRSSVLSQNLRNRPPLSTQGCFLATQGFPACEEKSARVHGADGTRRKTIAAFRYLARPPKRLPAATQQETGMIIFCSIVLEVAATQTGELSCCARAALTMDFLFFESSPRAPRSTPALGKRVTIFYDPGFQWPGRQGKDGDLRERFPR